MVAKDPELPVYTIKPEVGAGSERRIHRNNLMKCNEIQPAGQSPPIHSSKNTTQHTTKDIRRSATTTTTTSEQQNQQQKQHTFKHQQQPIHQSKLQIKHPLKQ